LGRPAQGALRNDWPMDKSAITSEVVQCLLSEQFPQWAGLAVRPVDVDGWDNTSFRLGDDLLVRLPSADGYASQVDKEQRWLPVLGPQLPVPIPEPIRRGRPGCGYLRPWSVLRWLPGVPLSGLHLDELALADDVATFLRALRRVDATGGPSAGPQSFERGADLAAHDDDVSRSLATLTGEVDADAARVIWARARQSRWMAAPVWLHGDVAPSNLLVSDERLAAVIDFGQTAVGDPACDLVMAWTFFDDVSRCRFLDRNGLDTDTVDRARGWALWKALITLADAARTGTDPGAAARHWGWSRSPVEVLDLLRSHQ
jgi:aminoglycoside phosphotransferase (APT) family kinase protein